MSAPRQYAHLRIAALSALGLSLALAPFAVPFAISDSIIASAYAKGGGGGGGGGGGNGNGNGNGGASAGNSEGRGNANGHDKNSNSATEESGKNGLGKSGAPGQADRDKSDKDNAKGAVSADLGKLNAAHASPTALSRAAPNSVPGMLGAYKDAVLAGMTPAEAEKALGDISNKSVNRDVVNAVNDLLGVSFSSPPAPAQ